MKNILKLANEILTINENDEDGAYYLAPLKLKLVTALSIRYLAQFDRQFAKDLYDDPFIKPETFGFRNESIDRTYTDHWMSTKIFIFDHDSEPITFPADIDEMKFIHYVQKISHQPLNYVLSQLDVPKNCYGRPLYFEEIVGPETDAVKPAPQTDVRPNPAVRPANKDEQADFETSGNNPNIKARQIVFDFLQKYGYDLNYDDVLIHVTLTGLDNIDLNITAQVYDTKQQNYDMFMLIVRTPDISHCTLPDHIGNDELIPCLKDVFRCYGFGSLIESVAIQEA